MSDKPQKTLEDLAKEVIDSQSGLVTPDDLRVLFEDGSPQVQQTQQAPVEPAPAPTPVAPVQEPVSQPTPAPAQGQPNILDSLPEKFRDADVQTSVSKMAKSYADLEAELKKQKEDMVNMNKLIQTMSVPPVPQQIPQAVPTPEEDVDEATFFEKPKEAVTKMAAKIAAQQILQYHLANERAKYVEAFKAQHPDFDTYREDMLAILKSRPDLDQDPRNLPGIYQMAQQRFSQRMQAMKSQLGIPEPSAPAPTQSKPQVSEEELVAKVKAALIQELAKRRAASGTLGGSSPTSPQERVQSTPREKPRSPDDAMFEEILNSGPPKLKLEG